MTEGNTQLMDDSNDRNPHRFHTCVTYWQLQHADLHVCKPRWQLQFNMIIKSTTQLAPLNPSSWKNYTNITGCCQTSLAWYVNYLDSATGAITIIIVHYAASTNQWEWLLYSKLVRTFW